MNPIEDLNGDGFEEEAAYRTSQPFSPDPNLLRTMADATARYIAWATETVGGRTERILATRRAGLGPGHSPVLPVETPEFSDGHDGF